MVADPGALGLNDFSASQTTGAYFHPLGNAVDQSTNTVQVWFLHALCFGVRVADVVCHFGAFITNFASKSHFDIQSLGSYLRGVCYHAGKTLASLFPVAIIPLLGAALLGGCGGCSDNKKAQKPIIKKESVLSAPAPTGVNLLIEISGLGQKADLDVRIEPVLGVQGAARSKHKGAGLHEFSGLAAGVYRLWISLDDNPVVKRELWLTGERRVALVLNLGPGYLSGKLAGEALGEVLLELRPRSGQPVRTTLGGADGRYFFANLPAGIYDLVVYSLKAPWRAASALAIRIGQKKRIQPEISLHTAAPLRGSVSGGARPVAGATVVLRSRSSLVRHRQTTDAGGYFHFAPLPLGDYRLEVWAPGWLPLVRTQKLPSKKLAIVMSRGKTVRGEVQCDGKPLVGALVRALAQGKKGGDEGVVIGELGVVPGPVPPIPPLGYEMHAISAGGSPIWSVTSDTLGQFTLSGLKGARVKLLVTHTDCRRSKPAEWLPLSDLNQTPVTVSLRALPAISGRVVDERGYPLVGATLVATSKGAGRKTLTDGYGRFRIHSPVKSTVLRVEHRGYLSLETKVRVPHAGALELVLPSARYQLKGRVEDTSSRPLAGALVSLGSQRCKTDVAGRFSLPRADNNTATISVSHPRFAGQKLRIAEDASWVVVTVQDLNRIHGRLRDWLSGAPVVRASIGILSEGKSLGKSDAKGRFQIQLAAGRWTLVVRAKGYAPVKRQVQVDAERGLRSNLDVEMRRAGRLSGTVYWEDGRIVAGAQVRVAGLKAVTDSKGAFDFAAVPEGNHDLEVKMGSRLLTKPAMTVVANQQNGPISIYLQ
jgi:hypothetical protein